jgi:membrane associated rhomboid family serine protease
MRRFASSMDPVEPDAPTPIPPAGTGMCYRHPDTPTGVHCTRCDRPICPECMIQAPVGYHCPSCVAEARREFRKGPGRRIAVANAKATSVTVVLLVAIVGMYLVEVIAGGVGSLMSGPPGLTLLELGASIGIGAVPPDGALVGIAVGQTWRLFTAIFLHGGLLHLLFNSYALWVFGSVVEEELGRLRFLIAFVVTGVAASAVSYAFIGDPTTLAVGASGAVFGIFGVLVATNWKRRATALGQARLRSAIFILVINAVLGFSQGGTIDWRAHLGGFVAGILIGFAADGFGRRAASRTTFTIGVVATLAVTVVLVMWRTAEIKAMFPEAF